MGNIFSAYAEHLGSKKWREKEASMPFPSKREWFQHNEGSVGKCQKFDRIYILALLSYQNFNRSRWVEIIVCKNEMRFQVAMFWFLKDIVT